MNMLRSVHIKSRILFLVVLPVVLIFSLSYFLVYDSKEEIRRIERLDTAIAYAKNAYPFITSALKESYYTRIYIDSNDIDEHQAKELMLAARAETINSQHEFLSFIEKNNNQLETYPKLHSEVEKFLPYIKNMQYIRSASDDKKHLSTEFKQQLGKDLHTMYEFNFTITQVVNSLNQLINIASSNSELVTLANAYVNLVQMNKESTFHNSMVNLALDNSLDIYIFSEIMSAYQKYEHATNLYYSFATPALTRIGDELIESSNQKSWFDLALEARSDIYRNQNKRLEFSSNLDWDQINFKQFNMFSTAIGKVANELVITKEMLIKEATYAAYRTIGISTTVLVIFMVFSMSIARSITSPLKRMVVAFKGIASRKDLTEKVAEKGDDELTELAIVFNQLIGSLSNALVEVKNEVIAINKTSENMLSNMQASGELLQSQFAATDDISVSINEMSSTVQEVAAMAASTSATVEKVHLTSRMSSDNVQQSRVIMDTLTLELDSTQRVMADLAKEAESITNVISIIRGIAEQTNLLALNAAIEAARAGDQGRGFAVVADEVRNLARRTQESTESICQQIDKLQSETQSVTEKMETLKQENDRAVAIVDMNSSSLEMMNKDLDEIMSQSIQIATATEEQTLVANEINERVTLLSEDGKNIDEKTRLSLEATGKLKQSVDILSHDIAVFKLR